jgi:hypothetical protein
MRLTVERQIQIQQDRVIRLHLPKVSAFFQMASGIHAMTRIAEAAQHHRLQDGVIFN